MKRLLIAAVIPITLYIVDAMFHGAIGAFFQVLIEQSFLKPPNKKPNNFPKGIYKGTNNPSDVPSPIKTVQNTIQIDGTDLIVKIEVQTITGRPIQIRLGILGYPVGLYNINDLEYNQKITARIFELINIADIPINASINVVIVGIADGIRVKNSSRYNGDLGSIDFVYYSDNTKRRIHLKKNDKLINEYIAFLRAYSLRYVLIRMLGEVAIPKIEIQTRTTSKKGSMYRGVFGKISIFDKTRMELAIQ